MMNPTLSDLIGGIQSVTLSDEEAQRRGTQKSVLERKAPPTFDVVVEIQNWSHVAVHEQVSDVVDAILRGQPVLPTVRRRGPDGEVLIEEPLLATPPEEPSRRHSSEATATRLVRLYPFGV